MATQTLQGIIGTEPLHWRGDRNDLSEFNPAFVSLNGNDRELTDDELARLSAFIATIRFPPNPYRNMDNSLRDWLFDGDPRRGRQLYLARPIDSPNPRSLGLPPIVGRAVEQHGGILACGRCHQLPTGTNQTIIPGALLSESQSLKVPQLRNLYEKTGFFSRDSAENQRGFGYTHAGSIPTLLEFLRLDRFEFGLGQAEQRRRDIIAFLMSFSEDTHAGVGRQVTLDGASRPEDNLLLDQMLAIADAGGIGLVAHGRYHGQPRGFVYRGHGVFQSDRAGEQVTASSLRAAAAPGGEITWTLVPLGSQTRIGIDHDLNGVLDGDE
jgi:hypothetical protein